MRASKTTGSDPLRVVSEVVEAGEVDTVYRDVYLDRARALLGGALPPEEFEQIEQQRTQLGELPLAIGRAVDRGDWPKVKELSGRTQALRQAVEGKAKLMEVARRVYAVSDISLDPFSPGLAPFIRTAATDLPGLRTQTIERLAALERADPPWQRFYAGRRAAFQALEVAAATGPAAKRPNRGSAGRGRSDGGRACRQDGGHEGAREARRGHDGGGRAQEGQRGPRAVSQRSCRVGGREGPFRVLCRGHPGGSATARAGRPSPGIPGRAGVAPRLRLESLVRGSVRADQAGTSPCWHPGGLPGPAGDADDPSAGELWRRPAPAHAPRRGRAGRGLPRSEGR